MLMLENHHVMSDQIYKRNYIPKLGGSFLSKIAKPFSRILTYRISSQLTRPRAVTAPVLWPHIQRPYDPLMKKIVHF